MPEIIQIINRTKRIRDARFAFALPGLQRQISADFAPKWAVDAKLILVGRGDNPDPTLRKLWLLDTSDDPGALGYHEDQSGVPEGKVFVEDDLRYGAEISVTVSHELLEMLADPTTVRIADHASASFIPPAIQYAIEVCDPVEADSDGYISEGIRVSNFVTPSYYGLPNPDRSTVYDQRGLLTKPVPAMRPGGYLLYRQDGRWQSTMARYEDGTLSPRAIRTDGRSQRRAAQHP